MIRNPLGEPHILGLNAGASLAVVATSALGISLGGVALARPLTAACGAALLFGGVMLLSSSGRGGVTPLRITLCGVALSAFASAVTAAILILDEQTLLAMRTAGGRSCRAELANAARCAAPGAGGSDDRAGHRAAS